MKTIEIIRNSVMQCIEKIEQLLKRISNNESSIKKQEEKIKELDTEIKIPISVMKSFVSSQFANFTYLYYDKNGDVKSKVFNDGIVSEPQISSYVISGNPLSYRCWRFTKKVEFKNFNTSNMTSMNSMFKNSEVTELDLSNFDTSAVTDMSYMFSGIFGFTSLDLSNFDTSSVTNMSHMFDEFHTNTSLNLSNFNNSAVTDMSYMFYRFGNIITLDFSTFNTSSVTNMQSMFENCGSLTSLDLSNFNTSSVTNMNRMFDTCERLTMLDLSNFNTSSVTDINYMFYLCSSLTSIIGTHTLEEVQAGTIKALRGLKVGISFSDSPNLERASILALFYGLADLTGKTAQTVTLHATAKARLTAEDIKIATDKNWNVQ